MSFPHTGGGPTPPPTPFTTVVVPSPWTTITVDTTLVRTTFTTTTSKPRRSVSRSCTALESSECGGILPPQSSGSGSPVLPSIASESLSAPRAGSTASTSHETSSSSSTGSSLQSQRHSSLPRSQKHAIIGALSSAIAALVLIIVLIALFLRRRQKREDISLESEKWPHQSVTRTWSQVTCNTTAPQPAPHLTPPLSRQSSTADVNGSVIRMSLGGFPRPFAHHKSWRESMGLGALMVMNPDDASETNTTGQRESVENSIALFQRPRNRSSVISSAFLRTSFSRASSYRPPTSDRTPPPPIPTISIDPVHTSDSPPYPTSIPSLRSRPSSPCVQTIQQQPPEDPFLTPPDERLETSAMSPLPSPRMQRPSITALQNAAGSATRSLSHLGLVLKPFRSKGSSVGEEVDDSDGTASRQSTLTFSSNGDPFKLDRRSIAERSSGLWSNWSPRQAPAVYIPSDKLYEGT